MRTYRTSFLLFIACTLLCSAASLVLVSPAAADLAVRAERIHTVSGEVIQNGVIIIKDGKIERVGPDTRVPVPGGWEVLEAAVVIPGLVDAHATVGLTGILNIPPDQDQRDDSEQMQPELRALDAYNLREPLVEWVRSLGVTTVNTGHSPGNIITGQTMVAKTFGRDADDAALIPFAMVAVTLGDGVLEGGNKSPGTRSKAVAMLRGELLKAQAYATKMEGDAKPDRDLRLEALAMVLRGEKPLLVTAQRHQDIRGALRLQDEFGFRLVLDGAAEAHLMLEEIRDSKVPVVLHPTMMRSASFSAGMETENLSFTTASVLHEAGILFAIQSGYESYVPKVRVVLFEAAMAAAYGLPVDAALRSVTLDAARILGVDDRVGSIEKGKDADLALYDGDPFEYATHCIGVIIDGQIVSREIR